MKTDQIIRKQVGAAAVEFAIILPLFLLIVFGIVEWSLYLFNSHIITNASREGARYGALFRTPSRVSPYEIEQKVVDYTSAHLVTFGDAELAGPWVNKPPDPPLASCTNSGTPLEVIVRYDYSFLLLPALTVGKVAPKMTITGRTVMRCE